MLSASCRPAQNLPLPQMLPPDEWLADAKRLAIGVTDRVYHGAEHRRNLVVRNLVDRWTCWCHACNEGGVVYKEHVRLQPIEPAPPPLSIVPPVLVSADLPDIHKHLHSKGMSLTVLREFQPQYSPTDKRLVLRSNGTILGRDLTGRSPVKWCQYKGSRIFKAGSTGVVVLTEDVYSAIKIYFYGSQDPRIIALGGLQAWACLGTGVSPTHRGALVASASAVVRWFDSDAAGQKACIAYSRVCRAFGIPTVAAQPVHRVDPKEHKPQEIKDIIYDASTAIRNRG